MKKVNVYLAEGFEEIEGITIIDVLKRGGIHVNMVAVGDAGNLQVTGAHGIPIIADVLLSNVDKQVDGHILPGGMPGTTNLLESGALKEILLEAEKKEKLLGAICAAPSVLGRWGLLDGYKCTCYPGFEKFLIGGTYQNEAVVEDGRRITSQAAGTAMEFGLRIIRVLEDKEKEENVRKALLFVK